MLPPGGKVVACDITDKYLKQINSQQYFEEVGKCLLSLKGSSSRSYSCTPCMYYYIDTFVDMTRSLVEVLNVMCWCISQLMVSSVFQWLVSLVSLIIKQFISLLEGFHVWENLNCLKNKECLKLIATRILLQYIFWRPKVLRLK